MTAAIRQLELSLLPEHFAISRFAADLREVDLDGDS